MDTKASQTVPIFPSGASLAAFSEWYKRKWLPFVAKTGHIWAYHDLVSDIPISVPPTVPKERGRSGRASPAPDSDLSRFIDDYGEEVGTPGAFRRANIRLLGCLIEALEHHSELCAHASTGQVYATAMVEIMRASRGGMAAYISDQRDEIVRVISACSDMEQLRAALVTVTGIRQILADVKLDPAETAIIRKTDYEDYEVCEFACKQFKFITNCGMYYEEYRRNPSDLRWSTLANLRSFVTSTANTRREPAVAGPGSAFALQIPTPSNTHQRTAAAPLDVATLSSALLQAGVTPAQIASAFASVPAPPPPPTPNPGDPGPGVCIACGTDFGSHLARIEHRKTGCSAQPQCTVPGCKVPHNHLTRFHDYSVRVNRRRREQRDAGEPSSASDTSSSVSGSTARGTGAGNAVAARPPPDAAVFTSNFAW